MYYDIEGNPVKLSHGQYGLRRENGKRYYLNKNGKVDYFLSLEEVLHGNTVWAIVVGVVLCMLTVLLPRPVRFIVLVLYILFIVYMTLLYREGGTPTGQFEVLWAYKEFFSDRALRVQLFQNIWLFIPFGAFLYYISQKRWTMAVPLVFSIVIEVIQYYTGRGLFEFDDMISNGLGGVMGFWFGKSITDFYNQVRIIHKKNNAIRTL